MPLLTAADHCDRNGREIGEKEAIVDRCRRLTWAQVKELSDGLAVWLLNQGLGPDSRVLVQLPNCAELFLVRLACEKAGVRLITVAPAFRFAELSSIVQFTRPGTVIISREFRGFDHYELFQRISRPELENILVAGQDVPPGAVSLEEILARAPKLANGSARLQESRHSVLDYCQIGTTSGSTGIPKCVEVPLYTRLLTGWIQSRRFGLNCGDTLAAVTSIVAGSADAIAYQAGCQLGARIVLIDHFSSQEICATLQAERVNAIPLVPTMMARMMSLENLSRYKLALRVVINHGASLPITTGREAEAALGCRIVQAYGTVDCGGISSTFWDDPWEVRLGTVGRVLDGNELRIVDVQGGNVGPGEVGRLLIRGLHTGARFIDNPNLNASRRQEGFFDLQEFGRMDEAGNLALVGREQDLIIRGGQNIYPIDVESALMQHPGISEVCVIGVPDAEMGERVCAFLVCRPAQSITISEVTSFLEEKGLARFKWPERIEVVSSLPKVASGQKIDKKRLKENLGVFPSSASCSGAP
jgi:non-ribosomal peptide synthetase component E (peptide arylation enzyme)